MKHHAFSLEVCVHDPETAKYVRTQIARLREALENDETLHLFRTTETHQRDDNNKDDDDDAQTAVNAVHLAS